MGKRIIKLGTWNSNPIEWVVLEEDDFQLLVISRYAIGRMQFDSSSSNNNWGSSGLRKFLKRNFFKNAFTEDEKKKIINTKLKDVNNVKDNVFILSENEVRSLLLKDGDDDYENAYYRSYGNCGYCIWTRTSNGGNVRNGFAKGCWCNHSSNSTFEVRPAMYLKK